MTRPWTSPARIALLAAVALLLLAPVASAKRVVETVYSGPVSATLSYDRPARGGDHGMHLRIRRHNKIVVGRDLGDDLARPARNLERGRSIALRNLDGDGSLEVVVSTFTGGARCCVEADVFDYAGDRRYRRVRRDFGDAGFRLRDVDSAGRPEFVSADTRFSGEIVAAAFHGGPIRIFHFRRTGFAPVTVRFPKTIRRNARFWLDQLAGFEEPEAQRGALAAYAADKALLGEYDEARATVEGHPSGGADFARRLTSFLHRLKYLAN